MYNYTKILNNLNEFYKVGIKVTYDNFKFDLEKTKDNVQIISTSPFGLSEGMMLYGHTISMESLVLELVQQDKSREIEVKEAVKNLIDNFNVKFDKK